MRSSAETDAFEKRLRAKLEPDLVIWNLAVAGLTTIMHECLKAQIMDSARGFFVFPGETDQRYRAEVLGLAESRFDASCVWLERMNVLTADDRRLLGRFRDHRHEVAHELFSLVLDPDRDVDTALLGAASAILRKIGQFWAGIAMDCDPDFDEVRRPDDEVQSGLTVMTDFLIGVLMDAAAKNDGEAGRQAG